VRDFDLDGSSVSGDKFSVIFEIDATDKASGQRWMAKEVALYEVEGVQIARTSFFMAPMGQTNGVCANKYDFHRQLFARNASNGLERHCFAREFGNSLILCGSLRPMRTGIVLGRLL
jgi:hypothetical protein